MITFIKTKEEILKEKRKSMTYSKIKALQFKNGYHQMQGNINTGLCWKFEGSVGREASRLLDSGACMLPKIRRYDTYGNSIPTRFQVETGSKGSFRNCQDFWIAVEDGNIDFLEGVETFEDTDDNN